MWKIESKTCFFKYNRDRYVLVWMVFLVNFLIELIGGNWKKNSSPFIFPWVGTMKGVVTADVLFIIFGRLYAKI